jgi:hypothetical protein
MKLFYKLTFILLLSVVMTSCSSTKITYDKHTDFSKYKTYAFYKKGIKALKIPLKSKKNLLRAISEVLLDKGYTKSSHPDFIVNIFTDIHKRVDVYEGYHSPFYRRQYVEKSKEGTVYLDIVDLNKKKVVWSGSYYINYKTNDLKVIKKAVYKLLEKFPPE